MFRVLGNEHLELKSMFFWDINDFPSFFFLSFGGDYCWLLNLALYMCGDLLFLMLLLYKYDTKLYISIHSLVVLASFFLLFLDCYGVLQVFDDLFYEFPLL